MTAPLDAALAPIVERAEAATRANIVRAAEQLRPAWDDAVTSGALDEGDIVDEMAASSVMWRLVEGFRTDVPALVNALRAAFGPDGVEAGSLAVMEHRVWPFSGLCACGDHVGREPEQIARHGVTVVVEALARIAAEQLEET